MTPASVPWYTPHMATKNIYVELTRQFNAGRMRALITSGQAVVLHRLAIMSKDGDWILKEDPESLCFVLDVLARHGARYRFGAPLDARWLAGGWSAHFEFMLGELRVRTDFFSRPPRIGLADLEQLWTETEGQDIPVIDLRRLAEMKKTNREKDYVVIGELARRMDDVRDQLLYSRSATDLMALATAHPERVETTAVKRPVLSHIARGRLELERALDEERRQLMHANEKRLAGYAQAAEPWAKEWPSVQKTIAGWPLVKAHAQVVKCAECFLPMRLP